METTRVREKDAAAKGDSDFRRRQGLRRRIPGFSSQLSGQARTFFFYNFPENLRAKDLWYCFQGYGKVVDVFVPNKRDKWGKRFGFVRMVRVMNEYTMEKRLNEIWFGFYKLRVRIVDRPVKQSSRPEKMTRSNANRLVQPGQSYAQVVVGNNQRYVKKQDNVSEVPEKEKGNVQVEMVPVQTVQLEKNEYVGSSDTMQGQTGMVGSVGVQTQATTIDFSPSEKELHWLEGGMVALLKSLRFITSIQDIVDVDGGMISVSPLGGRSVLLTKKVKGYLGEFMEQNKELFDTWFDSVRPWAMATSMRSRLVWLRVSGVPLKAWCDRCFALIGGTVGEVVMVHDDTRNKFFMCEGRVLVLCSDEFKIAKTVQLKIEGQTYEVGVVEEEWRSDPDWWVLDGDRQSYSGASSEYSAQSGDEDPEISIDEISAEDDDSIDLEQFQKEGVLNSNDGIGPGVSLTGLVENGKSRRPNDLVLEGSACDKVGKEGMGKRRRQIADCYPKEGRENREDQADWVTGRTKQRRARRVKAQQLPAESGRLQQMPAESGRLQPAESRRNQQEGRGASISDGCIAHRNRVIQQDLSMQEVRRLITAGRRLGMQFQGSEEEVESRFLELEQRDEARGRNRLGGTVKRRELGKLVRVEKPDFLFVQETKLEEVEEELCKKLWYSDEFGWSMKSSVGASGGLLCVWNRTAFGKVEEFTGDGYLGIKGVWGSKEEPCVFVNVYAPSDRRSKVALWDELRQKITEEGGRWLLAGDYNAVRCLEEKRGRTGMSVDMSEFDAFIETTGLVDIKLANQKFTWYRPDGTSMSRLDRILMTVEMSSMEFKKVVEDKWNETVVDGFAGYRCLQKLKVLKNFLKGWNKEVFGDIEVKFQVAMDKVAQMDMKNEEADLEGEELAERQEGFNEMWDIMKKREILWKQKSRCSWAKLGDANTRFFHKVANGRKVHNNINGFACEGKWVEEPKKVKKEVVRYFSKMFAGESWQRPKPVGINFKQISEEKKAELERPFSVEEIEEGLKSCEGSKAPGPDGFNFNFLKCVWNCLKEDFMSFFEEFHQNGRLVRGLNSSFITLIPKKLNPLELKDFRPISLIGCLYKLLAKVLANKLKGVMSGLISDTQSAFLGGRQLVDSVLVLNEVVDEVKLKKQKAFVFKADFEKAYDCVDWAYLDWMLCRMGFGMKWRGWMRECLSTARISVLVNGSPTKEFVMGRGLRQGDPLSPFLFLIAAEGLNGLVRRAETEGMLHGPTVGNKGLTVSLLQFADDTVILGTADSENVFAVKTILRCFELMSGLRINFSKSSVVGYNVSERWIKGAASVLHCGVGETSFMYLGLPIGGKIRCKKMWEPILKKFRAKLVIWKSSTLSFGGRITLLNSVLSAIPIFYMSLFLMPNCVVSELISIQRAFLWGGAELKRRIPWVKWDYICFSKRKGGLGVSDLCRKNWALLGKWWFRLGDGVEGLWKKVVWEKYYGGREEVDITALESVRVSRIWRDIISIGQRSGRLQDMLVKGFKWGVGEGCRVGFWRSVWVGEKALRDLCPRLFQLAINKEGLVSEMEVGLKVGVEDWWQWIHVPDGKYGVKQAYEFLESTESILNDWMWGVAGYVGGGCRNFLSIQGRCGPSGGVVSDDTGKDFLLVQE
ncbi:hypothetical protein SLEP1_g6825 [Rubroshorea leprosula]|uniref:Reverse transcriptase domain-containing protein n=1 Tax=Rubroshorea leprosula TaxID=152421 RepID=A0AAV5HWG9_9ROSI|nr:hypothetical protein SLEP1_g6825 [Rubroshorea leprosula]